MSSSDLVNTMIVVPVVPVERTNHLVVFIHGLEGNERTLRFLKATITEKTDDEENLVCYTATSNIGKTKDGIENGGRRLAQEVEVQLSKIKGPIALSFVGHSCGGLYARYALAHLKWTDRVTPRVFSTIATPHLGVGKHNLLYRIFKKTAAKLLPATLRDLLLETSVMSDMCTDTRYLNPLSRFEKRITLTNAYKTDFFVPAASGAFLSPNSRTVHITLHPERYQGPSALFVETKEPPHGFQSNGMAENLDALGWTKVFLDSRDLIALPAIKNPFHKRSVDSSSPDDAAAFPNKLTWTSKQLIESFDCIGSHWKLPLAHGMACGSERRMSYTAWKVEKVKPVTDQLARDVLLLRCQSIVFSAIRRRPAMSSPLMRLSLKKELAALSLEIELIDEGEPDC